MSSHAWTAPRGTRPAQGKIRVLVVDDSVVIRHLVMHALREEPDIEVVGAEPDGAAALARIAEVHPDVITLDIEMPVMDGLTALRQIRKLHPRLAHHHVQYADHTRRVVHFRSARPRRRRLCRQGL